MGAALDMICALILALALFPFGPACPAVRPVPGALLRPFAPQGPYAGHWGADLESPSGAPVVAVAAGVVTFAGPVAGRLTVTVHHGGGVRTSYSYLSTVAVARGRVVGAGEVLGASGIDHGLEALHLSLRVGEAYADPMRWLECRLAPPGAAGRLAPALPPYASPVRRGILGGTFDPPHLAHLVAGEAACRELGLDVVTFLPAGRPWQKAGSGVSPAADRWEMSRRAVAGVEYFRADDREVRRDGWTYTADTLATFPEDEDLVLILGADAAAGLPTWHSPEVVLRRAQVAVMERPGVDRAAVVAAVGHPLWLHTPLLGISGTLLRERRRAGMSLRFLVPDAVLDYIESAGLYAAL
ncbi:MAG: nicotinate-nucleotide adenylyltransferase [Acidimicrobiia bacterium]|nr:nicotinate-nucleotide adenylyltransferase [Acidimicrobiia bacterium]